MKNLLKILLVLFLATSVFGQWSGVNPMLGRQVNKAHQLGDPIALLLFNEGSGGQVFDLSGNGNTGTLVADTHFVPGKFGPALDFDGTGDYVSVAHNALLNPSEISIVVWVKMPAYDEDILSKGGNIGYRLLIKSNNQIQFYCGGVVFWGGTFPYNVWNQIVITGNSTITRGYLNGTEITNPVAQEAYPGLTPNGPLEIGAVTEFGAYLLGQIDHVMLYNRALSASEIALLYREPFCMFEEGLPVSQMYSYGAPPAGEGQVIFIQMASMAVPVLFMGLTILCFIIENRIIRKKCQQK